MLFSKIYGIGIELRCISTMEVKQCKLVYYGSIIGTCVSKLPIRKSEVIICLYLLVKFIFNRLYNFFPYLYMLYTFVLMQICPAEFQYTFLIYNANRMTTAETHELYYKNIIY